MNARGGRIVLDADGKEIARHHIDPQIGLGHLADSERDAVIAAAHGYDVKPGLRFNLMHGSKALPKGARDQLAKIGDDDRVAILDLGDPNNHGPILARLKDLGAPPAPAAALTKNGGK